MSTYRKIHGRSIQAVTTDPSESVAEGQVWYNTTSDTFKSVVSLAAWSSASPLATARYGSGGAGTQTAGLCIAGNVGPSDTRTTLVEEYNGTGFSTGGALPTATRSMAAAGTQTAAFSAGGYETANTAEAYTYDGSSWTAIPALNTARRSLNNMGSGTTTAALVAGGYVEPPYSADSEEYNGSSWSEGNNLNTARSTGGSAGTQTATILAGGTTGSDSVKAEQYDGTSWTEGPNINTARQGVGAAGTQTSAIIVGGRSPNKDATEEWDGSTWTTSPATLATARYDVAPATSGTSSTWMVTGGFSTAVTALTEEYNKSANVITAGAWGTGGAMNTARSLMGSFGTRTAAVAVAGLKNPYATYSNDTEKYDGTSWTASGNYPQSVYSVGSAGTSTAGLAFGGQLPGSPETNTTCEFDGSTWTAQGSPGNVPVSGGYSNGFGTQTAAIANLPGASTTIAYDGSSWTAYGSPGNMNTARLDSYGQNGTSTAGLMVAGRTGSGPVNTTATEEWDGSTWTASGAYPVAMVFVQSNGTQTAAAGAGGDKMPGEAAQTTTCTYDGSTWATAPNLGTAVTRHGGADGAPSTQGTIYSGNIPGITTTQEFTGETTAVNVKTLTQS